MANSYTLFSTQISELKPEEKDWFRSVLEEDGEGREGLLESIKVDDPEYFPDFCWKVDDEDNTFWVYSGESGNPAEVTLVVQAFLKKFRPEECFGLEYAFTCDFTCGKPRLDGFGGGACFVTANNISWSSATEWVNEQEKKFLQKIQRQKTVKSRKR